MRTIAFRIGVFIFVIGFATAGEVLEVRGDQVLFSLEGIDNIAIGETVEIVNDNVAPTKGIVTKIGKSSALARVEGDIKIEKGQKVHRDESEDLFNAKEGTNKSIKTTKKESLHDRYTGAGYGDAGCGLGSIIFGDKDGMVQIFAATTNNTYSNNTFGVSSGTSNCDVSIGSQSSVEKKVEIFVSMNMTTLENDIAKRQGETLASLCKIVSCQNHENFTRILQKEYGKIFVDTDRDSKQVSGRILRVLQENSSLAKVTI
ncbi:MAG: hypothetical protein A2X86_09715 [Bdellovibrionales bacterium GWA2_49_15]|nr:MAG: hypothetical protein A2X86_09715 [Bdellovibrionales bacterium GWA2_49_15]HAZ13058.1 hypothetical protein [Bdellovibrionales bacterium]